MTALPADSGNFFAGPLGEQGKKAAQDARERSNQNLIKFEPGMAQHPDGRRTSGASIKEWYNAFMYIKDDGSCKWDVEKLQGLILTPGTPLPMIIAAQDALLAASSGVQYAIDKDGIPRMTGINPEVGKARLRLLERLDGKVPNEHIIKDDDKPRNEGELLAAMMSLMADPDLNAFIRAKIAGQVGQPAEKPLLDLVDEGSGG